MVPRGNPYVVSRHRTQTEGTQDVQKTSCLYWDSQYFACFQKPGAQACSAMLSGQQNEPADNNKNYVSKFHLNALPVLRC